MNKILFNTKEEHWKWAYDNYLRFTTEDDDIWTEQQRIDFEPFFRFSDNMRNNTDSKMTPEEKESFEKYISLREAGHGLDTKFQKDFATNFEFNRLCNALGFDPESLYNDISTEDEDIEEMSDIDFNNPLPTLDIITYPFILVYWFETSFDRGGDCTIAASDFVLLSDFTTQTPSVNF